MRGVECAQGYWVMYYRCTHDVVTCAMRGVKRRQDCWVYYRCTHDAVTCAMRGVKRTPSVPLIWSQSILLKTRFGVSFGFFFVGLGMFVRGGNASVMAVNIT